MSRRQQISSAVILLTAGVLVAAFYIYQRPTAVAERALHTLATTPNQKFTADLQLENSLATQATLKEKGTIEVHVNGTYSRANARPALASSIDVTIKTESVSLQLGGETRLLDDKLYLLISKVPPLWPAIQTLKSTWVELPRGGHSQPVNNLPNSQVFMSVKRTGHNQYQAEVTQAGIVRFMNALAEILGTTLSNQQLDELRRGIGQFEHLPVTLTITPLSHQLQQIETTIRPASGNNMHFVLHVEPLKHAPHITAPDGAVSLESALEKR